MKKGYAYLDKYGVLHVTESRKTATKFSKTGVVIETTVPYNGGYPQINVGGELKTVSIYSLDEMYIGGNRNAFKDKEAAKVDVNRYKEFKELYLACK